MQITTNNLRPRKVNKFQPSLFDIEVWRRIEDFPNYAVSNKGQIKNVRTGRILKPELLFHGYLKVTLPSESGRKRFKIHVLVAKHFIGEKPRGYQVNHINEIKTDNRVENLEYVTPVQNVRFSQLGKSKPKLNRRQVSVILHLLGGNMTQREIAQVFQTREANIQRINSRYKNK